MSVVVTGSLVITGSTFVGAGTVTNGLDYYFDAGNLRCYDPNTTISVPYTPITNIAKGGGNPYVSGGFVIANSSSTALSYDTLYDPSFGGCLFVSRSGVATTAQATTPAIVMQRDGATTPTAFKLPTLFYQRYLAGKSELTLGIWFKRISSNGTMFQMTTTFSDSQPFSVWVAGDTLAFRFWQASNSWGIGSTPLGVNGRWNYYTIVFNNGVITGYTNGTPGTPVTLTGGYSIIFPSAAVQNALFQIGGSNGSPNKGAMIGYLGPAQIYSRALTQQEILQNYHTMKNRFGIYT